ncbi:unnamed protein product, partial [Closterium sp. NIES-54]
MLFRYCCSSRYVLTPSPTLPCTPLLPPPLPPPPPPLLPPPLPPPLASPPLLPSLESLEMLSQWLSA